MKMTKLFVAALVAVVLSASSAFAEDAVITTAPQAPAALNLPLGLPATWTLGFLGVSAKMPDGTRKNLPSTNLVIQIYPMPNGDGTFRYEGEVVNSNGSAVRIVFATHDKIVVDIHIPELFFGMKSASYVQIHTELTRDPVFDMYFVGRKGRAVAFDTESGVEYRIKATNDFFRGAGRF
ncbi:MAG: hypothetical protein WAV50_03655 [Minisyncoccia bacterium]